MEIWAFLSLRSTLIAMLNNVKVDILNDHCNAFLTLSGYLAYLKSRLLYFNLEKMSQDTFKASIKLGVDSNSKRSSRYLVCAHVICIV